MAFTTTIPVDILVYFRHKQIGLAMGVDYLIPKHL